MPQFTRVIYSAYLHRQWEPKNRERWFCGHCIDTDHPSSGSGGWSTESQVKSHAILHHQDVMRKEEGEPGYDWMDGTDLMLTLARWRKREAEEMEKYVAYFEGTDSVWDILWDAGER